MHCGKVYIYIFDSAIFCPWRTLLPQKLFLATVEFVKPFPCSGKILSTMVHKNPKCRKVQLRGSPVFMQLSLFEDINTKFGTSESRIARLSVQLKFQPGVQFTLRHSAIFDLGLKCHWETPETTMHACQLFLHSAVVAIFIVSTTRQKDRSVWCQNFAFFENVTKTTLAGHFSQKAVLFCTF